MFNKLKFFVAQSWLLIVSAFLFGLLIAVTNAAWSPRIAQNKINKINAKMTSLISSATDFKQIQSTSSGDDFDIYKALSDNDKCLGWCFIGSGSGFADKIEILIAVSSDFSESYGFAVLFSNETPGFGDKIKEPDFRDQFIGAEAIKFTVIKTSDPSKKPIIDNEIVAITGATVSSDALVNIVNHSISQVKQQMQLKGLLSDGK